MNNQIDYAAVREETEEQLRKRKNIMRWVFFAVNLIIYGLFLILGWSMFGTTTLPEEAIGGGVLLSVAGFMGILFQFITLMVDTKQGEEQMRKQIMSEVLSAQILRMGSAAEKDKPKREMTLTDDGELEPVSMDELLEEQEAARRSAS
jgi:hypothetical protein